jgi:hypothetical protein
MGYNGPQSLITGQKDLLGELLGKRAAMTAKAADCKLLALLLYPVSGKDLKVTLDDIKIFLIALRELLGISMCQNG